MAGNIPDKIANILATMRGANLQPSFYQDFVNKHADSLEEAFNEVFNKIKELEAAREEYLHPVSSGESVMEVIDIMYKFADRHWMHDEGQNTREFADRVKRSYLAERAAGVIPS